MDENEEKLEYIEIEVPDENDSMSRIVLNDEEYNIRFTYNDYGDYWKFGLYDEQEEPIYQGIKIVPGMPLNLFNSKGPDGMFAAISKLDRIGRYDFKNEKASFIFLSTTENDVE